MTAKIQKILCPLDFSAVSENALKYALQLADLYQAEVHLLHVLEPTAEVMMEVPQLIPAINSKFIDDARKQLVQISEKVLTTVSDGLKNEISLFTDIEIGPRGFTINNLASERGIDLIVMGTREEKHRSWWQGSVASEVLDNPRIPLLIIPEDANYTAIDRLSFATDLKRADMLHLVNLVDFLQPIKAEIRCIHVTEDENEQTEIKLEELVDAFKHQLQDINITFHELEEEDTTEALEAFNVVYHVDLQVLVKPRRNFFQALFHRSQSKRTALYTHIPLLVIPA